MIIQKTEKVLLSAVESDHLDFVKRMTYNVYNSATSPVLKETAKECYSLLSYFLTFTDYFDHEEDSDDSEEEEREGEELYW